MSKVFSLHLSDDAHDELSQHLSLDHGPIIPEAFGYLRYVTRADGTVRILEISNDLYDGLTSEELKYRYRDWQRELLDGFIEYVATAENISAAHTSEEAASFRQYETRTIVIPPAAILLEHDDEADAAVIIERYQEVPTEFGFSLQTLADKPCATERELPPLREALVLAVASAPEARVRGDSSPIEALLELYFELERFSPPAAPLPAQAVPRERLNALTLYPSFEVVPASTIPLEQVLAPACVYEAARHEHHIAAHRHLLDAVIEKDYTVMSRGFEGGMESDWAALPDSTLSPGVYVFPNQSELQNRHPSLRIVSVDEEGKQTTRILGIKGAGIADKREDSVVELPEGIRAPIYKTAAERVASHTWWGGLPLEEAIAEASRSIGLFAHVADFHPHLVDRVPFPLRLAVPTMYPVWTQDSTEWLAPFPYAQLILGESANTAVGAENVQNELTKEASSPEGDADSAAPHARQLIQLPFATLVTTTPSDVRVSTLVDRLFNGRSDPRCHPGSRVKDITQVMRFLYHHHGYPFVEPADPYPVSDRELSVPRVAEYLQLISEANRDHAKLIYQWVCGDTLAIIESVHRRGGHLGGGKITIDGQTFGIGNGGAPAMRNVDICGGLHDLAAGCHFPWLPVPHQYCERDTDVHAEMMKKFDLIYWAETEQWMRLVLFGSPFDPRAIADTFSFYPGHDVMLYSVDPSTPRIHRAAALLGTDASANEMLEILHNQRN